ncbi:hypothetical protein IBTHAUMO2_770041 [Nitrosopumilaceae archaeon]|nr:hypothetical protein [Nitrosopumilus sp.]CAI9832429.1 hypothetical protein IBTHAUMO2_770041 [Nitrosopumilaceae archaeon]
MNTGTEAVGSEHGIDANVVNASDAVVAYTGYDSWDEIMSPASGLKAS